VHLTPAQLTAQTQNSQFHKPYVPAQKKNESQKDIKTDYAKKLVSNAAMKRLVRKISWELSCIAVALPFLQFALVSSFSRVHQSDNASLKLQLYFGCQLP
jgi:hypothetical protein